MKQVTLTVNENGEIGIDNKDFHPYELHGLLTEVANHIAQQQTVKSNLPFVKKIVKECFDEWEEEERQESQKEGE